MFSFPIPITVQCEEVYGGYYSTPSPMEGKNHLNFCLEFDQINFNAVVLSRNAENDNSIKQDNKPKIKVLKGELWFYKSIPDAMDSHNQVFSLTEIDNWDVEGRFKRFQILALKQQRHLPIGWIKVDVSQRVMDWLSSSATVVRPRKNWVKRHSKKHILYHRQNDIDFRREQRRKIKMYEPSSKRRVFLNISCKTCLGRADNVTESTTNNSHYYRPFFMVDYKILVKKRASDRNKEDPLSRDSSLEYMKTRGKRNLNCSPGVTDCCREKLKIDFSQIGWDWIILPKSYDAYFCR